MSDATESLVDTLVTANRVLADRGIVEGFGHVSARHPAGDRMLISRSMPPGRVRAEDVLTVTLDGEVVDGGEAGTYKEATIHRAIYRERDDVGAVVHHHAREVMPFAITGVPLRPVVPNGVLFRDGVPFFSAYDDEFGRLIVTEAEGERMAASLGDGRAQLLAGHGANTVGATVEAAVMVTHALVQNADRQFQAMQLGTPSYYTGPPASVDEMEALAASEPSAARVWSYLTGEDGG